MKATPRLLRRSSALIGSAVVGGALVVGLLAGAPTAVAATSVTATAGVNVRAKASTASEIVGGLAKGQTVNALSRGSTWTKVSFRGSTAYVASAYLTTKKVSLAVAVDAGLVKVTTSELNLRTGPGTSYAAVAVLKEGTTVTLSGARLGMFAQIYAGSRKGWASLQYLAATTGLPPAVATRTALADLTIRTSAEASAKSVGEIAKGSAVSITGAVKNGRAQIVHRSVLRWVTAKYLSGAPISSDLPVTYPVEKGLTPNAIKVHRAALVAFPQITTYYGVRKDSQPDHPSGRALDLMIPNYKSTAGKALGAEVAAWARANARTLGIHYVIWNQRIWNIQRDKEGWRYMSDRGGDSANHKNHVHITVYA